MSSIRPYKLRIRHRTKQRTLTYATETTARRAAERMMHNGQAHHAWLYLQGHDGSGRLLDEWHRGKT